MKFIKHLLNKKTNQLNSRYTIEVDEGYSIKIEI